MSAPHQPEVMPRDAADGAGDEVDRDVSTRADQEDVPAAQETDHASSDPGVPSDNLRIVSGEPPRARHIWCPWDWHRSVTVLRWIVACLVIAIILFAIISGYLRTLEPGPLVPLYQPRVEPTPRSCDRPGCVLRAAETVLYLNRSVDPCSNFYGYACGGFDAAHPTGTLRPLGVRQMLEERNRKRVMTLLQEDQYFNTSSPSAIAKAKVFFATCMSSYERGANKVMTFVDLLNRLGGLELFGTWTIKRRKTRAVERYPEETLFDFNDVLSNTSLLHPEQAFFSVTFDRQLELLELGLPRLAMGFVEAVTRPGSVAHEQLTSLVRDALRVVLAHLEVDSHGIAKPRSCHTNCANMMVEDVLAVQDALSVLRPDLAAAQTAVEQRLSLSELGELVPQIDWRRLLDERYGEGVVPDTVTVQVPSSDYMAGVGRIIDDTRYQRLYHFLVWPVIRSYLVGLGPVYATLSEQLDHQFGLKPLKSREQQCLALLEKHMQPALHGLLLSRHIGQQSLPAVRDLLKHARGPLVDSFAWMTERSQRVAKDLLDSINIDFGDAPSIFGPLDDYFSPLRFVSRSSGFFHNLKELYKFTPPVQITQSPLFAGGPPESTAITYDPERQTLTVPYGALQRPWFATDVPPPLNAAALGSIVYDALSGPFFLVHMAVNESYSWDKDTLGRLDTFTDCVEDIIERRPVHQEYFVALSTSTPESIEHHFMNFSTMFDPRMTSFMLSREYFSLHLSHRLFSQLAGQEPDITLPGLHMNSSDQTFYLAYAQARCHNDRPEEEAFPVLGDSPRLPREISVNSIVYSDPAFRAAFQCGSRRPAEGVYRDVGSCELFQWPADGATGTPDPTIATEET